MEFFFIHQHQCTDKAFEEKIDERVANDSMRSTWYCVGSAGSFLQTRDTVLSLNAPFLLHQPPSYQVVKTRINRSTRLHAFNLSGLGLIVNTWMCSRCTASLHTPARLCFPEIKVSFSLRLMSDSSSQLLNQA